MLTPARTVGKTRYVIETVTSAGTPTIRLDVPVDAVAVLAWTRQYIADRPLAGGTSMIAGLDVVHIHPSILSGTPVFVGTSVPVQSLFDFLEGGESLDDFLQQFPSVTREQAIATLELARESVLAGARPDGRN